MNLRNPLVCFSWASAYLAWQPGTSAWSGGGYRVAEDLLRLARAQDLILCGALWCKKLDEGPSTALIVIQPGGFCLAPRGSEQLLHRSARSHYSELAACSGALARAQAWTPLFPASSTWQPPSPGLDQGRQRFTSCAFMYLTSKVGK